VSNKNDMNLTSREAGSRVLCIEGATVPEQVRTELFVGFEGLGTIRIHLTYGDMAGLELYWLFLVA